MVGGVATGAVYDTPFGAGAGIEAVAHDAGSPSWHSDASAVSFPEPPSVSNACYTARWDALPSTAFTNSAAVVTSPRSGNSRSIKTRCSSASVSAQQSAITTVR